MSRLTLAGIEAPFNRLLKTKTFQALAERSDNKNRADYDRSGEQYYALLSSTKTSATSPKDTWTAGVSSQMVFI
jgi:hypothetical protein